MKNLPQAQDMDVSWASFVRVVIVGVVVGVVAIVVKQWGGS